MLPVISYAHCGDMSSSVSRLRLFQARDAGRFTARLNDPKLCLRTCITIQNEKERDHRVLLILPGSVVSFRYVITCTTVIAMPSKINSHVQFPVTFSSNERRARETFRTDLFQIIPCTLKDDISGINKIECCTDMEYF
jgi:hypothetical protein